MISTDALNSQHINGYKFSEIHIKGFKLL